MITLDAADLVIIALGLIVALVTAIVCVRLSAQAIADLIAYDMRQQTQKAIEENRAEVAEILAERPEPPP
jgi:uncharacterized membrane-anchored protein YhcB (DUF1043 family)